MIENVISERYARALLGLAKEKGEASIDQYGNELKSFLTFCKENKELLKSLSDKYNDLFARERVVAEIADKAGFAEDVKNFLKLLVHKGRIALFATVCEEYIRLAHEASGRQVMKVVSIDELKPELYQELVQIFGDVCQKEMVLKKEFLPDVIGGLRVHIGDRVYDYTVSHQLQTMKQAMMN